MNRSKSLWPSFRITNIGIALVCAVMVGIALYFQYVLYLDPCPLCMVQRYDMIIIGFVCLVAFLHHPQARGQLFYYGVVLFFSLVGAAVAGRHVWLQNLPSNQVPECFPGIEFILSNHSLFTALGIIFSGTGECAETLWTFLGISIPGWTLIAFLVFAAITLIQFLRIKRARIQH